MTTMNDPTHESCEDESNPKPDTALVCIGPALWIFGMFVWSFIVAGEFTTAGFVAEAAAFIGVIVITMVTAVLAIRGALGRETALKPRTGMTIFVTLGLSALLTVTLALPVQTVRASTDIGMTLLLLFIGATAIGIGGRIFKPAQRVFPTPVRVALLSVGILLSIGTVVHVLAVN